MLRNIEAARRQGLLGELDVHFARLIASYDDAAPVVLAAVLLSQLTSAGHVCLDLASLAEQPVLAGEYSAPPLDVWLAALRAHPACGDAQAYTPLVLDGTRLYMRRYFDYECAVAAAWRNHGSRDLPPALAAKVKALFPQPKSAEDLQRDQRAAAIHALTQQRVLISGGPGTGKTTTLASILALLIEQHGFNPDGDEDDDNVSGAEGNVSPQQALLFAETPSAQSQSSANLNSDSQSPVKPPQALRPLKILLSAPTGKAAARMQDAIRSAKQRLKLSESVRKAMPETAQTLHRLLGARPHGGGVVWRHDAANPLDCDVLVVDEASMIDLALMARLLAALPAQARLILLGDRDQLASVDAGAVFADLCAAGAATLNVSFRFGADSGIGRLAALMRVGDADAVMRLLSATDALPDVHWAPQAGRRAAVAHAVLRYRDFVEKIHILPVAEVFDAFAAFRLLTPVRQGPLGVAALNAEIEKGLVSAGIVPPRSHWYVGKPVMIAANDYALRLFNGDIGICVTDSVSGELRVAFPADAEQGGVRLLAPARLPAHATAWAMTVHKSQGSEFDEVGLVLPDEQSEIVTRELLYTAITRARKIASLWANESSLHLACQRRILRHSGLVERLSR